MTSLGETVIGMIVDRTGKDPKEITEDTPIKDTGLDSLDTLELLMHMEDTFSIHIPDEWVKGVMTVGDVIELIPRAREVSKKGNNTV